MSFDFSEYANDEGIPLRPGPSGEIITTCPICLKDKHLYYNTDKNLWICHKCGERGNYLRFVMIHQNLDFKDAVRYIQDRKVVNIGKIRKRIKRSIAAKPIDFTEHKVIIPPPRDSKLVTEFRYPSFFSKRKYDKNIILALGSLVCETGQYTGRIIFPFTCDGHESFVAYASNKYIQPKTLNPLGSNNSDLLYGFVFYMKKRDKIYLVEGITDMVRLLHYGFAAVSLLGKSVTNGHLYLLNKLNTDELVLCLDGDVGLDGIIERAKEITTHVGKHLTMAYIADQTEDPDSLPKEKFMEIAANRITLSNIKKLRRDKNLVQYSSS